MTYCAFLAQQWEECPSEQQESCEISPEAGFNGGPCRCRAVADVAFAEARTKELTEYIVITAQVVGNPDQGFRIAHYWDGERWSGRTVAIAHGWRTRESDDFNIGVVFDGKLASIDWMEEVVDNDPALLSAVAEEIGL